MKKYTMMRFPGFKYKALTLSYDDDVIFDKKLMEILDKHGLKCTFNLNSGLFAEKSGDRRMTEAEAKELFSESRHEIAVHGVKHLSLSEFDKSVGAQDVLLDRINLERLFGRVVKGMAYANGSYSDEVVEMLKTCGIDYARTVVSTHRFDIPEDWLRLPATCHHKDEELEKLADEFLKDYPENDHYLHKHPKLFYLWGHAYEFNDNNNWEIIEKFAEKVGDRDDVWYATNGEIFDYVKAYDGLIFSVSGNIVKNPSSIDVYTNFNGKETLIRSGETVCL